MSIHAVRVIKQNVSTIKARILVAVSKVLNFIPTAHVLVSVEYAVMLIVILQPDGRYCMF